ncbi:iron chelate uptake ABC transporter family permease subunit [Heliobacterium gestii]|uniref:Iron chelate uptake ABC transporter family permease subunit n=1 Tax=Heliomicrobium gestii TaxID=2699 RepID=A0A845LDM0_HELGE|nr:metal ABC transporter permease [Heliomicrobium gestii]MBM7868022.1 zinc transport system permease protein [Heliomicrobium gestii]MZP44288.1 iron chelate uptake ABC transporter family permease subunit [Heliomicrobium gestii]
MPEMLQHDFMVRALLAGIMVAVICPVIGLFLVLRRLSLIGDTISHVSLAGVAGGMLLGVYPPLMALGFSIVAVLGLEKLRRRFQNYAEISIAVFLSGGVALAVILLSMKKSASSDVLSYLFGSIVAVNDRDLTILAAVSLTVLLTVGLFYHRFFYITLNEEKARLSGLPVNALNLLIMVLTALVVAASMRIVGILLVSSMLVLPVAASLQVARSFRAALWLALAYGLVEVSLGLAASYYYDLAPGGTIVLLAAFLLVATIALRTVVERFLRRSSQEAASLRGLTNR